MIRLDELLVAKLFLFDVGDTLLFTYKNGFKKINAAAIMAGLPPLAFDEYAKLYGVYPFEVCLQKWFKIADVSYIKYLYKLQKSKIPYEPTCDFGESQALLNAKGIQCGILTNGDKSQELFEKLNIAKINWDLIVGVWGSEDIPYKKPDPRALTPVLSRWKKEDIVYFGDSYIDYQMCLSARIQFVQVLTGKDSAIEGCQTLKSVRALGEFLDRQK